MPIISIEIMKTIDERELQKNNKRKTNKGRKEQGEQNLYWKGHFGSWYADMEHNWPKKPDFG